MGGQQAVVDRIETFEEEPPQPPERPKWKRASAQAVQRPLAIRFANGKHGLLDLALARGAVWLDVMRGLHDAKRPVHVEIDDASGRITQLLQPRQQPIGEIKDAEDGKGDLASLRSLRCAAELNVG